jgi:anti-sigma-K factor RskA
MTSDTHPDELLALYAVDALEPDEREAIERHLASCPRCEAELAAHHDALAALTPDRPATDGEWRLIADRLEGPPPESVGQEVVAIGDARRRRLGRLAASVAAAAAVAAVVIGSVAVLSDDDGAPDLGEVAAAALEDPSATVVQLVAESGTPVARTVLTSEGVGYVFLDDLEDLPQNRTYQLWSLDRDVPVSLGLLGDGSDAVAVFHLPPELRRLAVSEEEAGGAAAPTGPVVAVGTVPT